MERRTQQEAGAAQGAPPEGGGSERWAGASAGATAPLPWGPPSVGSAPVGDRDHRMAWLARTIEAEIIPRLMLAHRPTHLPSGDALAERGVPRTEEIEAFGRVLLEGDAGRSLEFVGALQREGLTLESIYLDLFAPTARHFGSMWEADTCDFSTVTLGLWRLQQVMYELSPSFQAGAERRLETHRALLAPVPGSQHTLGLFMVAEFFRRAGWDVVGAPSCSANDLIARARGEWFDLVGLSVGSECHLPQVTAVIQRLREASRNPSMAVLVGGPIFVEHPELVHTVAADATAADAPQALREAEQLLARRDRRC